MGKVGKSYPRFETATGSAPVEPAETRAESDYQTRLGAIIGAVSALGLIVWLMALLVR